MIQPFSYNQTKNLSGRIPARDERAFRNKAASNGQITGNFAQKPPVSDRFLTNCPKNPKLSFKGIIRQKLTKIINLNPRENAKEKPEAKISHKKTLRKAAIALGSVIGAGVLFLGGVYFYRKPTKADKALKQLLDEKFLPFQNAVSEVKNEIKTFKTEVSQKRNKLLEPVMKDFENFQKLPEKTEKEKADEVLAQIHEFQRNSLPNSYFENAANEMDELCKIYLQKISEKFEQVEPKYNEFTKIIDGELPKSRHSTKIIQNYKQNANFDYQEAKLAETAYKTLPISIALDFRGLLIDVQSTEVNHINKLLSELI